MKLLHIADLHIGKRVNGFNMLEEQEYILGQILHIIDTNKPDGLLIAGDVYDKSQPSTEAVELLDSFLTELAGRLPVFMISGNHDSPERLGFCSRIMQKTGLYIAGVFSGSIQMVPMKDRHGTVNIYMLPYLKPAIVRPYFDQDIETYEDAVALFYRQPIYTGQRNILLAHQFVTWGTHQPLRSESESISVGGTDNVDVSVFDAFDYVALGHLHGPQAIGRDTVRYSGSPLKYSFSEVHHNKAATLLEMGPKGEIDIRAIPLTPRRDMRRIKGPIARLLAAGREDKASAENYIHATVTDEEEIYDAIGMLRQVYPNLMVLDFENSRSRRSGSFLSSAPQDASLKSPVEMFSEFYSIQNNARLTPEQLAVIERVFSKAVGKT